MPILAIGSKRDDAFSLVEAMVTLVIIGLLVSGVMLAAPGPDRQMRGFAEEFAARVSVASEESIVTNRPHVLVLSRDGFGYMRQEASGLRRLEGRSALGFRAWPEEVSYRIETPAPTDDGRVARFDALGGATPAEIVLSRGASHWRVSIDGGGFAHVARAE